MLIKNKVRYRMDTDAYRKGVVYGLIQQMPVEEAIQTMIFIRNQLIAGIPYEWEFEGHDCELDLANTDIILEILFDIKDGKEVDFNEVLANIGYYEAQKKDGRVPFGGK
jgi:hypothetical protein